MRATSIYHIFVSGRVQGVGYRRFAQKQAETLSLQGWARNLLDGRVEIVAIGPESDLDQFCEFLKKGPSFSQVREVVVKTLEPQSPEAQLTQPAFEIRRDMEFK